MKLADCVEGDVVQNQGNQSFYRYARPEGNRVRIRPLELFPNGLLIAKPTDTIVEQDLMVEVIGRWSEEMFVQAGGGKSRATYEREVEKLDAKLLSLQQEALEIDPTQRGSHANKVRAVVLRLDVLARGLEDRGCEWADAPLPTNPLPQFQPRDFVQMPSGKPAMFVGFCAAGSQNLASVMAKVGNAATCLTVAPETLRPLETAFCSTV